MARDDGTSLRIELLRFPLIVGVVFIHSYGRVLAFDPAAIAARHSSAGVEFTRFFISYGIAQTAVPLFFLISGYLFFAGEWSWKRYTEKLKRRVHTLLVPFLFWNLAAFAFMAIIQSIPQTKGFFAGTYWPEIHSLSPLGCIDVCFGLTVPIPCRRSLVHTRPDGADCAGSLQDSFFSAGKKDGSAFSTPPKPCPVT